MTVAIETETEMGSGIGQAMTEKRIFVYGEHRLPDPGAQYTNEDVRQYLAGGTFPELANCRIDVQPMKEGIQEVHFVKQATTKGSGRSEEWLVVSEEGEEDSRRSGEWLVVSEEEEECEETEGFSLATLLSLTPSDGLVDVVEWNEVAAALGEMPTPAVVCAEEHEGVVTAYIEQVSRFDGGTQRWSQRCLDVAALPSSFIPLGW